MYVNNDFTAHSKDWVQEESKASLSYLGNFVTQLIFIVRVVWELGTVVAGDNRLM